MKENTERQEPPDIFRAAQNGDLEELSGALELGQTLRDRSGFMTPVHLAAKLGREDFIEAAMEIDPGAANEVDGLGLTAIEYSYGRQDLRAIEALSTAMASFDLPYVKPDL